MFILLLLCLLLLLFFSYFRYLCLFPFIVGFLFPFPVFCLCLFLCFLLSFYFFLSFYCFYFFLDLPSVAWFSLHFRFFSFPLLLLLPSPISLFFSFPLWVFLLSPLVPLSRLFCSLSATLVFPFLPFSPFPHFLSSSFVCFFPCPFFSTSYWLFFLLVCPLSHLLCSSSLCFSFPFLSCLSSLPFSLSCLILFWFFFTCPCSCLLHLFFFPLSISLPSSFLLPWLRPLSLPSSLCLLLLGFPIPFSFCFFLLLFLPLMSPI